MNKAKISFIILITFAICIISLIMMSTNNVYYGATKSYRVYLKGETIGLVQSKEQLEKYIDYNQQKIKDQYLVDNVYIPEGLEIKEETTYNAKISEEKEIYNQIKDKEAFTIEGYEINIDYEDENKTDLKIYVLDEQIFRNAVNKTVLSFVDETKYQNYLDEMKTDPSALGETIENVYVKENITITEKHISTNKTIFTSEKELSKYLLFSTTSEEKTYVIKEGETISEIAENNKLATEDFLIANPDIVSEQALLFAGKKVNVTPINPIITITEILHTVTEEEVDFKTEKQEDTSLYTGYSKVIREGEKGESKISRKIQKENGILTSVVTISNEVIKEPINKIVKIGKKTQYAIAVDGDWAWPTKSGYVLMSRFGYRRHPVTGEYKMHDGQDISGTGYGSPIYAVNTGTVTAVGYSGGYGLRIVIDHHNGIKSLYAHLSRTYVQVGQAVQIGQVIGGMGNSGLSSGTHLHLGISKNGTWIDPLSLYR